MAALLQPLPCQLHLQPYLAYLPHMMRDKKVLAGELRLVLPTAIGQSEVRAGVPHDMVLASIEACLP